MKPNRRPRARGKKRTHAAPFEQVFTISGYWDGPRVGVANYRGKPHHYACIFDQASDEYSELYRLTPISPAAFRAEMEVWKIWNRWDTAFHSGRTDLSTHPALPRDAEWFASQKKIVDKALVTGKKRAFTIRAIFSLVRKSPGLLGAYRKYKVEWLGVPTDMA